MSRTHLFTRALFVLGSTLLAFSGHAQEPESYDLDIDALPLMAAVKSLSDETGIEVLYFSEVAEGVTSTPVKGEYTPQEALETMLVSTDLEVVSLDDDGAVAIRPIDSERGNSDSKNLKQTPIMMAQNQPPTHSSTHANDTAAQISEDEGQPLVLEEIVVTGTNIRGIAPESSPVFSFDRDQIESSGASTVPQFLATVPQNFGGGSNQGFGGLPNDSGAQFNESLGSSINIHGLGSSSTLVLLNGGRIAPSSAIGDFVDVSLIPASALERIELLTDGASSIYGGDAVAGVANFILRDDYEGIEVNARYGSVTDGDMDEYKASILGGKNWDSGNGLFVYEYFDRGNLSTSDRQFSASAIQPNDLLPAQSRHSVLGSISQQVANSIDAEFSVLYSDREAEQMFTNFIGNQFRSIPSTEALTLIGGVTWNLSEDWTLRLDGNYSSVDTSFVREERDASDLSVIADVEERQTGSDLWSIDAKVDGSLFRVPGGDVKIALGGHYRSEDFSSSGGPFERAAEREVLAAYGEMLVPIVGRDNAVPGVDRLELSVSGRIEDYSDFGSTADPKIGVLWAPVRALKLRSSYGTSFSPPALGRVGAEDFTGSLFPTGFLNAVFGLTPADPSIANVTELVVGGTDNALREETSETFTLGVEFNHSVEGTDIRLRLDYFDVSFENRVNSTPIPENRNTFDAVNIAFLDPSLFPPGTIIFNPTQSEIDSTIAGFDLPLGNPFGLDPATTEIINLVSVERNLGSTNVRGIDFDASTSFAVGRGDLSVGVIGSYLFEFSEQATPNTPTVDTVDTAFNPVDFRARGHVQYSDDDVIASLFINYTDGYSEDSSINPVEVDSFVTVDLTFSYDLSDFLCRSGCTISRIQVSAVNLFDEQPPAFAGAPDLGIFGYDATNASPLGRFLAVDLRVGF